MIKLCPGSAKANRREPKSYLGRVFNFKLGCFVVYNCMAYTSTAEARVENLALVLSCQLTFAHALSECHSTLSLL